MPNPSGSPQQRLQSLNQCRHVLRYRELLSVLKKTGSPIAASLLLQLRALNKVTTSNSGRKITDYALDLKLIEEDGPVYPLNQQVHVPSQLRPVLGKWADLLTLRHILGILPPVECTKHIGWATDGLLDALRVAYQQEEAGMTGAYIASIVESSWFVRETTVRHGYFPAMAAPVGTTTICFVVCISHHWVHICLHVPENSTRGIISIDDSLGRSSSVLSIGRRLAKATARDPRRGWENVKWEEPHTTNVPQQRNSSDCGFFALQFAISAWSGKPVPTVLNGMQLRFRAARTLQRWTLSNKHDLPEDAQKGGRDYGLRVAPSDKFPLHPDTDQDWFKTKQHDKYFDEFGSKGQSTLRMESRVE